MRDIKELYEKIERKIEELKRKRKELERKLKQEKAIATRYAKEILFCFAITNKRIEKEGSQKWELNQNALFECLVKSLCKRAKHKTKCLKERIRFTLKYYDGNLFLSKTLKAILDEVEKIEKNQNS